LALESKLVVYPGHISNPISFDEKLMCNTLGDIKNNVEILQLNEEDFINNLLQKIPERPPNYDAIVKLNLKGNTKGEDLIELEAGANRCAFS
jgi:hypothetical protein